METQQIPFPKYKTPYIWVYELLRAGASQIKQVGDYGLRVRSEFEDMPLPELRKIIDLEYFVLSQAHYERYFDLAIAQPKALAYE